MTAPLHDQIEIDGTLWLVEGGDYVVDILAVVDIQPEGSSSARGSGFFFDLAVRDGRLVVDSIHTWGGTVSARAAPAAPSSSSPVAVPVAPGLPLETSPQVDTQHQTLRWPVSLPLSTSGTLVVGRGPGQPTSRQAMWLNDRRVLELDRGRVVSLQAIQSAPSWWSKIFG